jgi:hypothetical protein
MVQRVIHETVPITEGHEIQVNQLIGSQTEKDIDKQSEGISTERVVQLGVPDANTICTAAREDMEVTEIVSPSQSRESRIQDEEAQRDYRAKANALMDADCLQVLRLFNDKKYIIIGELNNLIKNPKSWLNIATLVKADYLEIMDSTVRITPEGKTAWEEFGQFQKAMPKASSSQV